MDDALRCPTCGNAVPNGSPLCEVDGTVVGEAEVALGKSDVTATFNEEAHQTKQEALAPPKATTEEDAEAAEAEEVSPTRKRKKSSR